MEAFLHKPLPVKHVILTTTSCKLIFPLDLQYLLIIYKNKKFEENEFTGEGINMEPSRTISTVLLLHWNEYWEKKRLKEVKDKFSTDILKGKGNI